MSNTPPSPGDRRPIASRKLILFRNLAAFLAHKKISANAISLLGMLAAIAAAICLGNTISTGPLATRLLFLAAAAGIQLRLLANMLDGMVAIAAGKASPIGELFNEIPDRISDTVILVSAGYAATGNPTLGWAAACLALFITYIRAVGKTLGVPGLFQGPMSKSHRMFLLTLACLYLALAPATWQPSWQPSWPHADPFTPTHPAGTMTIALEIVLIGGIITALRCLTRIAKALRHHP